MLPYAENEKEEQELTIKQRLWVKTYLQTGNATEAAMQAYNCKDRASAAQIGYENLRKLDFTEFLEESGISDVKLLNVLKEGLKATRVVSAKIISKDAGERTDDFIEIPDYVSRHKYLETALKLKNRLADGKNQVFKKNEDKPLILFDLAPKLS